MTNQSTTTRSYSRLWDLVSVILGVLVSAIACLNTINNTDGLVLVFFILAASVVGGLLSTIAIGIAGESALRKYAVRGLLFSASAGCVIITNVLTRQF